METLTSEEMSSIKGGGEWVYIDGEWYYIEGLGKVNREHN